mmetsp:Transcript_52719/g.78559  ORF Transcript_52719/g.78559 Transcript_52719/m.78559 type:complete len:219 (-) Transcript_52719:5147-5803(-)
MHWLQLILIVHHRHLLHPICMVPHHQHRPLQLHLLLFLHQLRLLTTLLHLVSLQQELLFPAQHLLQMIHLVYLDHLAPSSQHLHPHLHQCHLLVTMIYLAWASVHLLPILSQLHLLLLMQLLPLVRLSLRVLLHLHLLPVQCDNREIFRQEASGMMREYSHLPLVSCSLSRKNSLILFSFRLTKQLWRDWMNVQLLPLLWREVVHDLQAWSLDMCLSR